MLLNSAILLPSNLHNLYQNSSPSAQPLIIFQIPSSSSSAVSLSSPLISSAISSKYCLVLSFNHFFSVSVVSNSVSLNSLTILSCSICSTVLIYSSTDSYLDSSWIRLLTRLKKVLFLGLLGRWVLDEMWLVFSIHWLRTISFSWLRVCLLWRYFQSSYQHYLYRLSLVRARDQKSYGDFIYEVKPKLMCFEQEDNWGFLGVVKWEESIVLVVVGFIAATKGESTA